MIGSGSWGFSGVRNFLNTVRRSFVAPSDPVPLLVLFYTNTSFTLALSGFYLRLTLRVSVEDFLDSADTRGP